MDLPLEVLAYRDTVTYVESKELAPWISNLNIPHIAVLCSDGDSYIKCEICTKICNGIESPEEAYSFMVKWDMDWWPSLDHTHIEAIAGWIIMHTHNPPKSNTKR